MPFAGQYLQSWSEKLRTNFKLLQKQQYFIFFNVKIDMKKGSRAPAI